ncbi:alpha/beta fold hydrolase [Dactylosporangium sp. CA-139066]|uniref:alpha/beta fold hydrolase n=1 Tax=Dactylosporangium sp. CA-139066 TaxID=3239930 RepID=UPI003D919995
MYADLNGINLYYETHGEGRPLILLHGGLGSGEMFGPVIPALAARRQVIAVDLQGHGRTADVDRPLDLGIMGSDIAALIGHLGLEKAALVGYSLGGGVALRAAADHPHLVEKLVAVSAHARTDAVYPEMRAQQGQVGAAAETARGRATYAEVEESEADLERFRAWIAKIIARDYFGAPGRTAAQAAIDRCAAALADFEAAAVAAETGAPQDQ